ncbi:MAG: ABC-F family ATP-binding cassette domain-containing protein [Oscillospiraceae bacterium]
MLTVTDLGLSFASQKLFDHVNLKFLPGSCYGVIGANGAGKSTFLKILSGELEPTTGEVTITKGQRMSVLGQDHYAFEEYTAMETVILGNKRLYELEREKEALYAKPDFSEADGELAAELEGEYAELGGWTAESDAATLLNSLGIPVSLHDSKMSALKGSEKVKVILAQALFGNPDILILDEPINDLDLVAVAWLEEFLINYEGIVIVVSHDRHFLNNVCSYIADVDFGKIRLYTGNYDFWYQSSQLAAQMMKDQNRKKEEKVKQLQAFIARFSANASKSRQATSRKKLLEKITIDDIQPSNRRYPFIAFDMSRETGKDILMVEGLSASIDGVKLLDNVTFYVGKEDKIAFIGNENSITALFQVLMGELEPDSGSVRWGVTITPSYFPRDNSAYFGEDNDCNLLDWLRPYAKDNTETYLRGYLGKMLFSGEEVYKKANVLSGGEKVRCMLARMMMQEANVLLLDQPTNHLDLETITALNNGLTDFKSNVLFTSHDHELLSTVANRVIELQPGSMIDQKGTYDDYLERNLGIQA